MAQLSRQLVSQLARERGMLVAARNQRARRHGFTLVELTIAIAVMLVLFSAAVLSVRSITGARAKEATTELAGVVRSLYDTAALTGRTCRLVFELPGAKDEDGQVKYRAECAKGQITARKDREIELREAGSEKRDRDTDKRFKTLSSSDQPTVQELLEREKGRVEENFKFSSFTSEEIPERALPSSVRLSVWTKHQRNAVTSGPAFLYFFPQGFTERAQIVVSQSGNDWTLSVAPLTGKVSTVAEALEVPRS